jgi:hypothetical protein
MVLGQVRGQQQQLVMVVVVMLLLLLFLGMAVLEAVCRL